MNRIVWLASYPKSGNTWLRVFLTNLLRESEQPAEINDLDSGPIASARQPLDLVLGYESGHLSFDEVDRLRQEFYLRRAQLGPEGLDPSLFMKVHDAYTFLPDGRPLFPPAATAGILYIIRNPLDVCVSYTFYKGHTDFGRTVREMAQPQHCVCGNPRRQSDQLRQRMSSWSQHAVSWVEAPGQRVHILRYEDMKLEPESTFIAAARFLGLPHDSARIQKSLRFSDFDELKSQEEKKGFKERLDANNRFFRKGQIGSWRESLSVQQADQLVQDHSEVMRRFGYLDQAGRPFF